MSATHDNALAATITRGVTGNVYIDCAMSALGLDLAAGIRTALTKGVSKKVAKELIKSAVKMTLGTTAGIVATMAIWSLCTIGIS